METGNRHQSVRENSRKSFRYPVALHQRPKEGEVKKTIAREPLDINQPKRRGDTAKT